MTHFLHYDDPAFERHGGVYIPYATLLEAERQAAWDMKDVDNDPTACGLLGIFEAEYGSHKQVKSDDGFVFFDENQPFGHLVKEERKVVMSPSAVAKNAKQHQRDIVEEMIQAYVEETLDVHKAFMHGVGLSDLFKAVVPGNAYTVVSGGTSTAGAIALVAATAKTVIGVAAGSVNQPSIVELGISFDGVTASAIPVLCEWVSGTNATNAPGTNSTSMTPKQVRGWPAQASQATAAYNWSAEPTVLEVFKKRLLTPNGGLLILQNPLGREPTAIVTAATQFKFVGHRLTAPATVNCHVDLEFEE